MEKFILINKNSSRIKVFEHFQDSSNPSSIINAIMISSFCVYKLSSKSSDERLKGKSIKKARKENKELLAEGGGKNL